MNPDYLPDAQIRVEYVQQRPGLGVVREALVDRDALKRWREGALTAEALVSCADGRAEIVSATEVGPSGGVIFTNSEGWLDAPSQG